MKVTVLFYDLAQKRDATVESPKALTCREAASRLFRQIGRDSDEELNGVIYMVNQVRMSADELLSDGDVLSVFLLLGGG